MVFKKSGASILNEDIKSDNEDMEKEDGTYSCDGCGWMIDGSPGVIWFKCTLCTELDFCRNCRLKDIHSHHKAHITAFMCPSDINAAHCDACGFEYGKVDTKDQVYQCQICEDYSLCEWCQSKQLHLQHFNYLKAVPCDKYISDIG